MIIVILDIQICVHICDLKRKFLFFKNYLARVLSFILVILCSHLVSVCGTDILAKNPYL